MNEFILIWRQVKYVPVGTPGDIARKGIKTFPFVGLFFILLLFISIFLRLTLILLYGLHYYIALEHSS